MVTWKFLRLIINDGLIVRLTAVRVTGRCVIRSIVDRLKCFFLQGYVPTVLNPTKAVEFYYFYLYFNNLNNSKRKIL